MSKKNKPDQVIIFDTTLRDGEQSPGCSMNLTEKMQLARLLQKMGVDVIEAGFPISSPGDFEAVSKIAAEIEGPIIAGLCRSMNKDIDCCWEAVKHSANPRIHTFIATSDVHIERKFKKTRQQVKELAIKAVERAVGHCSDVEFTCEDAGRSDWDYMCEVVEAVIAVGATTINLPDTVGYATPWEIEGMFSYIIKNVSNSDQAIFSIHCHNDLGLAVANSLAAVRGGGRQVECTINGIGERAGNCSLEEVIMGLRTRKDFFKLHTNVDTTYFCRASSMLSTLTGQQVQANKAIVGRNAFAHEAGIHQDGMLKERTTYEIMTPESVGWKGTSMVMGKHSGRHAFRSRLEELGFSLEEELLNQAFAQFKILADKKKTVYDEDLGAIVEELTDQQGVTEVFQLDYIQTTSGSSTSPTAMVKLIKNGKALEGTGTGDGPVDAAYKIIKKLSRTKCVLADYNIKSVTSGADAIGEVFVTLEEDGIQVVGRDSDTDIIVASARAFVQALNKMEARRATKQKGKPQKGV